MGMNKVTFFEAFSLPTVEKALDKSDYLHKEMVLVSYKFTTDDNREGMELAYSFGQKSIKYIKVFKFDNHLYVDYLLVNKELLSEALEVANEHEYSKISHRNRMLESMLVNALGAKVDLILGANRSNAKMLTEYYDKKVMYPVNSIRQ